MPEDIYIYPKISAKGIKIKMNIARMKDKKSACKTVTLSYASI